MRKNNFSLFLVILLGFCYLNCGSGGGSSDPVSTTVGKLGVGSVATLDLGSSGSGVINFEGLTGNEQFILATSSVSQNPGSNSIGVASLSGDLIQWKVDSLHQIGVVSRKNSESVFDATSVLHENLRSIEGDVALSMSRSENQTSSRLALDSSSPCAGKNQNTEGQVVQLNILNSLNGGSYESRSFDVVYVSENFIAYRDQRDRGALSDSDLRLLIDGFESKVDQERQMFGHESDRDGNGKVGVVFSSMLNNLGGSGGIVTGYFYAIDLYSNYSASNCGEFIYSHVPGGFISRNFFLSNTGPTVLPHELQHAINYNQHVFVNNGSSSDSGPHNEGKSHFAEDLVNNFISTSAENPSRVELCLALPLSAFIDGTSLADRGCAYLYYRYLYEQAELGNFPGVKNGSELIGKIESTSLTGFDAIEKTIGTSVKDVSLNFFIALYLSNTGLTSDNRYNFTGINLRGPQNDNRGTYLNGPGVSDLTSLPTARSVSAMSADYAQISGSAIKQASNALKFTVPASSDIRAVIIRVPDE